MMESPDLTTQPDPLFDALRNTGDIDNSGTQVVPPQVLSAPEFKDPERKLMFAVLEEAIDNYKRYAGKRTRPAYRRFVEVHGWFFGPPDPDWPFCFENICDMIGVNEDYIRRGLREWRDENAPNAFDPVPFKRRKKTSLQAP